MRALSFFVVVFFGTLLNTAIANAQSNIEIVQSTYAPPPDNLFAAMAPDIEWTEMVGLPFGGTFVGPDAIIANVFSNLQQDWEGFHPEPEQFIDGGDMIVVTGAYKGTNKATGKSVEARFTHVYTLDAGKIVKFEQFTDTHLFWEAMTP